MELTGVRGWIDDLLGKLPASTRRHLKLLYQRGTKRPPVHLREGIAVGHGPRRHWSSTLPLVHAGPLPSLPWLPPPMSTAPQVGDAHACLVAAGDLDQRLQELLDCERTGTPIVCLASTPADLRTEIAGIASALVIPSMTLLNEAAGVLPEERVVVAPTILPRMRIPAAGLAGEADRENLVLVGPDAASVLGDRVPSPLQQHQFPGSADVEHLLTLASTALAVLITDAAAGVEIAATTFLGACGVPVLGPVAASHPLHGLVDAAGPSRSMLLRPDAGVAALLADPVLRSACGVRVRREALTTSSLTAVLRKLLPALEQPVVEDRVAAVTRVHRIANLPDVVANLRRIRGLAARVIVTDAPVRIEEVADLPKGIELVPAGRSLQRALRRHGASHVAVLDERCWYGPDHVTDLLLAWHMGCADISGHGRHHRVAGADGTVEEVAGAEEEPADRLVPGTTLLPIGLALPGLRDGSPMEEAAIVERAQRRGADLYAVHRFGFLRRDDEQAETDEVTWATVFPDGDGGIPFAEAK